MKTLDIKSSFIELRARGLSYAKIASQLSVSKQTLINWSKSHRCELVNLKKIERDALLEKLELTENARLSKLSFILNKVQGELIKRDFSTLSTDKLCNLFLNYFRLSQDINPEIRFISMDSPEISIQRENEWNEV